VKLECCFFRSILVQVHADVVFSRETSEGVSHVAGYFHTPSQIVSEGHYFDLDSILSSLNAQVDTFNSRGSGYILERVTRFVLSICRYRPLHGSSYIKTPHFLIGKRCIVNVVNEDNMCFKWSVLSALHEPNANKERVSHYLKYTDSLNFQNIQFPMKVKDVSKFENLNPTLAINILSFEEDTKGFIIEYLSPHRERQHHINLLIISEYDEANGSTRWHYAWVRNLSALVCHRTKCKSGVHVCNSCLNPFSSKRVLEQHIPYCLRHAPQQVVYPDPKDANDCTMKFRSPQKQHKMPFYLVCDLEAFLTPIHEEDDDSGDMEDKGTHPIEEHHVSGYCCYRVTDFVQYQTPPLVYSGADVMNHFFEHVIRESEEINTIIRENKPMTPLSQQKQAEYRKATVCGNCGKGFTHQNYKVRHHCHISGEFLFPACNACNLSLKATKCKGTKRHYKTEKEDAATHYMNNYFLPVVFHNLMGYDGHLILKKFAKKYVERRGKNDKVTYEDVRVIPINGEKYLQFQIGNLRFLDSFQFVSASLDNLVSLLLKSGKENFHHTRKYLGESDLVYAKGVYPYGYMVDSSKFAEKQLPPIEEFYDKLKDEPLSEADYDRANQTWREFNIGSLQEYHDLYLKSDTLLLADVFESFRQSMFVQHRLDCLHFPTLPSLAWAAALRHTDAELDLITDPNMYLLIENSIRGGMATISNRYSKANNPYLEGYDESKPTTYITYLDANNLYGHAQSQALPVGNYRFLSEREVEELDLMSVKADAPVGYIVECDLEYPEHLHEWHNDYPLAPEHMTLSCSLLSPFVTNLIGPTRPWIPTKKLIPNFFNKTKYCTHYRNLQFYVKHGLVIKKIHRVLSFTQSPWLKPWIDLCTEQRKAARTEFEADLAKLQANATFGKTIEQKRNRVNVRLIADENKFLKAVGKPSFRKCEIINEDLVMVRGAQQKVKMDKLVGVGFSILELSKLTMYEFYYNYLKDHYGDKCKLLFTDTDSLCCEIETEDIYAEMALNLDMFDTSNFPPDHPLFSMQNHRVLGKMKSETGSLPPDEFVGLRPKCYSLNVPGAISKCQKKVKGVQKHYVKKHVRHGNFIEVLRNSQKTKMANFCIIRSKKHNVRTVRVNKLCLCAIDDKRYVLEDGERTLAYGHRLLKKSDEGSVCSK